MKHSPKFFKNFDNNHCLQVRMQMAFESLGVSKSIDEIEKLTDYDKDKWTWTFMAVKPLADQFLGTKMISNMDYSKFAEEGEQFYREHNKSDPARFKNQKAHASPGFAEEREKAKILNSSGLIENRRLDRSRHQKIFKKSSSNYPR